MPQPGRLPDGNEVRLAEIRAQQHAAARRAVRAVRRARLGDEETAGAVGHPFSPGAPAITNPAWSGCVWLCAVIELPAAIRIIPIIPPVDSTCWSIFIDTPGHPVGDQARADVSSFVWYMQYSP